jgi:uncharacterized iron-regulated membrane protein
MNFAQPRGFRKSMSWLHTWSGLVLGWLLFAIFVTGALSYFRNEITFWMQPELHRANPDAINFAAALEALEREAPDARQWTLTLPSPRNPTLGLNWVAGEQGAAGDEAQGAAGGRGQRPEGSPDGRRGAGRGNGQGWQGGQSGQSRQGERGADRANRSGGQDKARGAVPDTTLATELAQGRAGLVPQNEWQGGGRRGEGSPGRDETQGATFGIAQARFNAESATKLAQGRAEPDSQNERREGRRGEGSPARGESRSNGQDWQNGQNWQGAQRGQGERGAGRVNRSGGQDEAQGAAGQRQGRGQAQGQAQGRVGAASQNARGGGGSRGPKILLDPASGERLEARKTAGGDFLYRFHFELYGIDRIWARWLVGVATLFMFVALITGVIIHRQIFKDFFTFRPGKGKRSWLDAHNLTGILSLPFHLVITFSGLLLFGNMLIPTAMQSAYPGDANAYMQAMRARMGAAQNPPPTGEAAPLAPIEPIIAAAERAWGGSPVGSVNIINPGDRNAIIELRQQTNARLTAGRSAAATLRFSGVSGEALPSATPAAAPSVVQSISNVLVLLHRGFFATPMPRWLLFLSGIGGVLLIATGLIMWSVARGKQRDASGRAPFGHRLVEVMNVAVIAGLPLAIAAYFWMNRLTPIVWENRAAWEIGVFFGVWALTIPYALLCEHKAAWVETLAAAGALLALLPIGNAMTGGMSLIESLAAGRGLLAGFDLAALLLGAGLLYAAYKTHRYVPPVGKHRLQPSVSTDNALRASDNMPHIRIEEQPA